MYIPYKLRLLKLHLFRKSEGEKILKGYYKSTVGVDLKIIAPETFSEKLFSRMVLINRHGNKRFTRLADKLSVRDYVKEKIGEKYLIPLIWHGSRPVAIPFDRLPKKCVIKTNHGSGGNLVVHHPVDRNYVIKKLTQWLKENFYWSAREYHYYKIPRKVLIEEFIDDEQPDGPLDYRFWCFHGVPEIIQVDKHKHDINPFYDLNWQPMELAYRDNFNDFSIKKPINLAEMIEIAKALSREFDFVRVDLYNVKGKIYFGELTFTPVAGRFTFKPELWDKVLGDKWNFEMRNQI